MTWADDGELYASSGDPYWGGKGNGGLDVERFSGGASDYLIEQVSLMPGYEGNAGGGAKPSGMICVDGVLYLAWQNLHRAKPLPRGTKSQSGGDATIVRSRDRGRTWEPDVRSIREPMFPGHRFGGPSFVNFGRNHEHARDGFVYAVSSDHWDNGSHLRVGRAPRDRLLEAAAWEWVAEARPVGGPRWSRRLDDAVPVLTDPGRISLPDMAYVAGADRFVLLTWRLAYDWTFDRGSELVIYDAPEPWGPFTLVYHEPAWEIPEITPYCPRLPLKWLAVQGDTLRGYVQFSGRPGSPHYRSHIRPFRVRVGR